MKEDKILQYMQLKKIAVQCHKRLDNENASFFLAQALSRIIPIDILTHKIEDSLSGLGVIRSKVVFLDGEQHIGYVESVTAESVFLTKILLGKSRSYFFYDRIFPHFDCSSEQRKNISPFHSQQYLAEYDLHLITMYKVNLEKVYVESSIEAIIKTLASYSNFPLEPLDHEALRDDIVEFYLINEHRPGHPIAAIQSFGSIHKKEVLEDLFKQLYQLIEKDRSPTSHHLLQIWDSILLEEKLYMQIDISRHYTVQHSDFFLQNLTISNGNIQCIDWECVRISPRTTDLAGILVVEKVSMSVVKNKVLPQLDKLLKLTFMDKVLFLFMLWICWMVVYQDIGMEDEHIKKEQGELLAEVNRVTSENDS